MGKALGPILGGIVLGAIGIATFGVGTGLFGAIVGGIGSSLGIGAIAAGAIAGGLYAAGLYGLSSLLKPKIPSLSDEFGRELQLNGDPVAPRKILYGEAWTAGTLRYRNTTGTDNKDLYLVIVLAGHPMNSVQAIEFDGETVALDGSGNVTSPSKWVGLINVRFLLGSYDQLADATLVATFADWTDDHRLRGLPYAIVKLSFDEEDLNTVPQMRFKCRGREVYDPRKDSTNGGSGTHILLNQDTWEWSDNTVLCGADYLRGVKYKYGSPISTIIRIAGMGVDDDRLDWANVIAEANVCDEDVDLAASGTQKRYTVNGFIDPRQDPGPNLRHFEVAMAGDITFADGKWRFFAGAYRAPTLHLEDKHFIGPLRHIVHKGESARVDTAQGVYASSTDSGAVVDYPPVRLPTANAGSAKVFAVDFALVNNSPQAQRCAKLLLEKEAAGKQITCTTSLYGYRAVPGETINVTHAAFGLSTQAMRVIDVQLTPVQTGEDKVGLAVDLTLEAGPASLYAWDAEETAIAAAPPLVQAFVPSEDIVPSSNLIRDPSLTKSSSLGPFWQSKAVGVISETSPGSVTFVVGGGANGTGRIDIVRGFYSVFSTAYIWTRHRQRANFGSFEFRIRYRTTSPVANFIASVDAYTTESASEGSESTSASQIVNLPTTSNVWTELVLTVTFPSDPDGEFFGFKVGLADNNGASGSVSIDSVYVYPATAAIQMTKIESAAGVIPVNYNDNPGEISRYGKNEDPGTTDMTSAIQAWLDVGGTLTGPKEVFRITSKVNITKDGTHIYALGMKIVHDTSTDESVLFARDLESVTIIGLEIDGQKSQKSVAGVASAYGIEVCSCQRVQVSQCYIHDTYEHGLRTGAFDNNDDNETLELVLTENIIEDCGNTDNNRGYGVWNFGLVRRLVVSNNLVIDCIAGGISSDETSSGALPDRTNFDVLISDNFVRVDDTIVGSVGIRFEGTGRGAVTGNLVAEAYHGLVLAEGQAADGLTGELTVSDNVFRGSEHGARIVNVSDVVITGNLFEMYQDGGTGGIEIFSGTSGEACARISVADNIVRSVENGIRIGVNASNSDISTEMAVIDNQVFYIGVAPASGPHGIRIDNTDNSLIKGNRAFAFDSGLTSLDGATWDCNEAFDCQTQGMLVSGSDPRIIRGNITHNCDFVVNSSANLYTTFLLENYAETVTGDFNTTYKRGNYGDAGFSDMQASATVIADIGSTLNTVSKHVGMLVWDTTNNRLMRARAATAAGVWDSIDGSVSVTPS
jgi:hypothetical protein